MTENRSGPDWIHLPDELWRTCIAEDADHFMLQLERVRSGRSPKFNFHACFFGLFWMFYRKMYLVAGCALILMLVGHSTIAIINRWVIPFEPVRVSLALMLILSIPVLMGYYADRTYLWHIGRIIQRETAPDLRRSERQVRARLALSGGTSWSSVIGLFVGMLVLFYLLGYVGNKIG